MMHQFWGFRFGFDVWGFFWVFFFSCVHCLLFCYSLLYYESLYLSCCVLFYKLVSHLLIDCTCVSLALCLFKLSFSWVVCLFSSCFSRCLWFHLATSGFLVFYTILLSCCFTSFKNLHFGKIKDF